MRVESEYLFDQDNIFLNLSIQSMEIKVINIIDLILESDGWMLSGLNYSY